MEETNETVHPEKELNPTLCTNCQLNKFEEGYPTKLCYDCRKEFVNFPVPKWIYIAAGVLLTLLLVELFRTPGLIMGAIHLARGEKAISEKKYQTATRELDKALEVAPNSLLTNVNMLIASSYCMDNQRYSLAYQTIGDRRIEDQELYDRCIEALNFYGRLIPMDTAIYYTLAKAENSEEVDVIYKEQLAYDSLFEDLAAATFIADRYYDLGDYKSSEEVLQSVLEKNDHYGPALNIMAAIKRNEKKCDEALAYCDRLLELNAEDEGTYAQKARIELKRNNDKEAAKYAGVAMELDANNPLSLEAKAMVEYFSKDLKKSHETLNAIKAIEGEGDHLISIRLAKILNGETIYR
jgi:tetratricopeptide (TPR) repeat protein